MKKKILIIYENINREYDNCMLLKAELQRRGYKVVLKYKTESMCIVQDFDIVITPNCYTIDNEKFYRYIFAGNHAPILSLQCEQVFVKKIEKSVFCYPSNDLKNVFFSAWGENYRNKLLSKGINESSIKVNGAIHLDFCRQEFRSFYRDKRAICDEFGLNSNKKIILFISSLTLFKDSPYFKHFEKDYYDKEHLYKLSKLQTETQIAILNWFEKFLSNNEEYVVVYRRHPVEEQSMSIKKMLDKFPNSFFDISDLGVKQWVSICDYCCVWLSTSGIEVAEFNKPMILLRPYPIDSDSDYDFFKQVNKCKTYQEFQDAIICNNNNFYIKREMYSNDYCLDDTPSFLKICNYAEEIINSNNKVSFFFERGFNYKRVLFLLKGFFIFKLVLKNIYKSLYKHFAFRINNSKIRNKYCISQLEYSVKFHSDFNNSIQYDKLVNICKEFNLK